MRYRRAALSCFVLVAGLFGLPAVVWSVYLPSLRQGLPNPIPMYERALLEGAVFCDVWKWLLALPLVAGGVVLTIVGLTVSRCQSVSCAGGHKA